MPVSNKYTQYESSLKLTLFILPQIGIIMHVHHIHKTAYYVHLFKILKQLINSIIYQHFQIV